jgi:hypothetical protein
MPRPLMTEYYVSSALDVSCLCQENTIPEPGPAAEYYFDKSGRKRKNVIRTHKWGGYRIGTPGGKPRMPRVLPEGIVKGRPGHRSESDNKLI